MSKPEIDYYVTSSEELFPGAACCNSKKPSIMSPAANSIFVSKAKGSWLWTIDGKRYLDLTMGLGCHLIGYNDEDIQLAVRLELERVGVTQSMRHPIEVDVGLALQEVLPLTESIRFCLNGSDAVNAAVRMSRYYTGCSTVLVCKSYGCDHHGAYHGWSDWCFSSKGLEAGVPFLEDPFVDYFLFNDIDSIEEAFERHTGKVAAVVMEGMKFIPPLDDFLGVISRMCRKHGACLVFDEIVNGLRHGWGGMHAVHGVTPDLVCIGKAYGSGYPFSAVLGKKEVMECANSVGLSLTYAGFPLSLAAVKATIDKVSSNNVIAEVAAKGSKFKAELESLVSEKGLEDRVKVMGTSARFIVEFYNSKDMLDHAMRLRFQEMMLNEGVFVMDIHNICFEHSKADLQFVLSLYDKVLEQLPWESA